MKNKLTVYFWDCISSRI